VWNARAGLLSPHVVAQDPNKPKRGMSAYMLFATETRGTIKAADPTLTFGGVAKEISRRWSELPVEEKEVCRCDGVNARSRLVFVRPRACRVRVVCLFLSLFVYSVRC
jgi:hypothetical protein